jgi:hypothetical protein
MTERRGWVLYLRLGHYHPRRINRFAARVKDQKIEPFAIAKNGEDWLPVFKFGVRMVAG